MRIIQIGVGGWGKNHIRILSQLGVLSAICDTNSKKASEYGKQYSVNHYHSLDDLISFMIAGILSTVAGATFFIFDGTKFSVIQKRFKPLKN